MRKDVTQGFDQVAHPSCIAQLLHPARRGPPSRKCGLLDPSSFRFTGATPSP
jgi:hypothetical protein